MFGLLKDIFGGGKNDDSTQVKQPVQLSGGALHMEIKDVFCIEGRGLMVTGTVDSGDVVVGQEVAVSSLSDKQVVKGIEMFGKNDDSAHAGDSIGLLFSGLTKDQVNSGDIITD